MRRQTTSTIGEALSLWIEEMKLRSKVEETRLMAAWNPIVGPLIAAKTRDLYVKNRTLYVSVDSSVIRRELLIAKEKLISQLNDASGGDVISDIVFR
ncbi:MAG: DUF721 domain-containing protein [Salinivirgaceae bacterium]|nr:DUF721 domain-containing protein [Salinivirgaceae bacterium]